MQHMKYRPDIDGLRAIAILPVLFYHSGSSLFSGGYVGVDVFFVISGYLITRTIRDEIEAGNFTILGFYERRARRILPALFATMLATFVAGAFIFMPDEFRELGTRIVAVAFFASNILFWQQADYFAGPVELEPLVHTWSLAVEEQFYILFPLFLVALSRFGKRRYFIPTLIVAILSLLLSVVMLKIDATGDYYLLPTRAWELLVGSLLAYERVRKIHRHALAEGLALAGIASIIGSALLLTKESPFPGLNALWPCLGAGAIIYANGGGPTTIGRVLSTKPFVAIGLISYSLYLVHWPIFVFLRYQLLRDFTPIEQFFMISAMIGLAALSWRFIERPFRNKRRVSRRAIFTGAGLAIAASAALGGAIFMLDGLPQRFPGLEKFAMERRPDKSAPLCMLDGKGPENWAGPKCFLTHGDGPTTLLWGDSHASQYRFAIPEMNAAPNVLMYATMGCVPIWGIDVSARPKCRASNDRVPDIIRDYHVKTVILSANWDYSRRNDHYPPSALANTIARLRAMGVRVKVIGDNPYYSFANPGYLGYRLSKRADANAPYFMVPQNDWSINPELRTMIGNDAFFDPMNVLCKPGTHECMVYARGKTINKDIGHLSPYGSTLVMERMKSFLAR